MAHARKAGVHHVLRRGMIERFVETGAYDREIIRTLLEAWISVGDLETRLATLREYLFAAVDDRIHFRELQLQSRRCARRQRLPMQLSQQWFGIEGRSEEHTSELQSRGHLVCRLL